jgi:2'-hydroxyisoflavone reductase
MKLLMLGGAESDAHFTWVSEQFLLEQQVAPFTEIPLWLPQASIGILQASIARAIADGLTFRPLADAVRDTLEWYRTHAGYEPNNPSGATMRAGLSPERERELLQAWKSRVSESG